MYHHYGTEYMPYPFHGTHLEYGYPSYYHHHYHPHYHHHPNYHDYPHYHMPHHHFAGSQFAVPLQAPVR